MSYYLIIRGPLGCGKSTIAEKLAVELGAKLISVDTVLDEHHLDEDMEDGYVAQRSFLKINEVVASDAKLIIESGIPVIFDGNFYWQSTIEDLIERLPYSHWVFTLKAP